MAKKESKNRLEGYQEAIEVKVEGTPMIGTLREFKTGSIGYNFSGKAMVDGKKCQVTGNVIIIGTKPETEK